MKPYLFLATLALVACSGNQQHKPGSATAHSTDAAPNAISFPIDITPVEPAPAPSMNQTNFMTTPPAQPMNMAPPAGMAPAGTAGMSEPMGTTAPAPMHSATPVLITPEVTVTPGTAVVTPPPSGPVVITPGTSSGPVVTSPPPTTAPAPAQPAPPAAGPTAAAMDTQVSDALNMISVEAAANKSAVMSQSNHPTPPPSTSSPAVMDFNAQVQSAKSQVVGGGSGS